MSQQEQEVKATFQKIREKLSEIEQQIQECRRILKGEKNHENLCT